MKTNVLRLFLLILTLTIGSQAKSQNIEFKPYVQPYVGNANSEFETAISNNKQRHQAQVRECARQVEIAHSKINPSSYISDGTHRVYAIDNANYKFCKELIVNVKHNSIVFFPSDYDNVFISKTYPITKGKTSVVIADKYGILGVYEVYFFE